MRLGVITDEVSQDFEVALDFAKTYGLDCVELRSAYEKGPFEYTEADILAIKALSDRYGIPVTAISSPMFKCEYSAENIRIHTESFKRLIGFATILGATKIRCFDFLKSEAVTHEMIRDAYEEAYRAAEAAGITILIESEPTTNCACCADIAALVRFVDRPYFKALYDPGNNIYATDEIPFPDGYRAIEGMLAHVHIKDAMRADGETVATAVGDGAVDYPGIFAELKKIGYKGDIMLETHYRLSGGIDEKTLKNPKGSAISDGGYAPSALCMERLLKLLGRDF
ncbi:MAG: sugar phosphate isomerase/epimerase [Clostridia bacterium]|nr:sugar phosphate isomerase/epimerase [Clostridia bacterium]